MTAVAVTLVARYSPDWPTWYAQIAAYLAGPLEGLVLEIEHLGSTSIPGMVAKPIIDLVAVIYPGRFDLARERLAGAGYDYRGNQGIPGREVFRARAEAPAASLPAHHLYLCLPEAHELSKLRAFQSYMREHASWREQLSAHKWRLAEALENRRQGYIDGKDAMMREIMRYAWEAAGVVPTPGGPPRADEIRLFLECYPSPVMELATSLRGMLRRLLPGAQETLDAPGRLVGYGYGTGYRDTICTLIPGKQGVRLGLLRGASLADPEGLLQGQGRVHRSLYYRAPADLDRPGSEPLVRAALEAWESAQEGRP